VSAREEANKSRQVAEVIPPKERYLRHTGLVILAIFVAALAAVRVYLLSENSVPMFHDTFLILQLQYSFFNEFALHNELPLWLPYVTAGVRGGYTFIESNGIIPMLLLPFAPLLKGVNFLPIFDLGVLFDEFALTLGCVLLGRAHFKSWKTVTFVTAAVVFPLAPTGQLYWNLHSFYLIPLIMYCLERAIKRTSAKYLFLSGIIAVASVLGSISYLVPLWFFAGAVFVLTLLGVAPSATFRYIRRFITSLSYRHLAAVAIPALAGVSIAGLLFGSLSEITVRKLGRDITGGIGGIAQAIGFGPAPDLTKYYGLTDVYANDVYLTVYVGVIVIPFVAFAIWKARSKMSYAFGFTGLLLVLFSGATLVSVLFYYLVPFAALYRYVSLSTRLATFFVVFYAGFGFDAYVESIEKRDPSKERASRKLLALPLVVLLAVFAFVLIIELKTYPIYNFLAPGGLSDNPNILDPVFVLQQPLQVVFLFALFIGLFSLIVAFPRTAALILLLILSLHVVDTFTFGVEAEQDRGQLAGPNFVSLFDPYNYNFTMVRMPVSSGNDRFMIMNSYNRAQYTWQTDLFLFGDTGIPAIYTDSWPSPLDELNWAFVQRGLAGYQNGVFVTPKSEAYDKIVGLGYPKVSVFSRVVALPTLSSEEAIVTSQNFTGDQLLTTLDDIKGLSIDPSLVQSSPSLASISSSTRVNASFQVEAYDFQELILRVNLKSDSAGLLYYADTWDPNWVAYVNGTRAPIIRADIAYKAVPIPPGVSLVRFFYQDVTGQLEGGIAVATGIIAFFAIVYIAIFDLARIKARPRFTEAPGSKRGEQGE
jgi:hypothetical protein